jgi:hypothetical protein
MPIHRFVLGPGGIAGMCALVVFGAGASILLGIDFAQRLRTYSWEEARCTISTSEVKGAVFHVTYRYWVNSVEHVGDEYRHGYGGSRSQSEAESASRVDIKSAKSCLAGSTRGHRIEPA